MTQAYLKKASQLARSTSVSAGNKTCSRLDSRTRPKYSSTSLGKDKSHCNGFQLFYLNDKGYAYSMCRSKLGKKSGSWGGKWSWSPG